jgi:hypothetical protein
MQIAVKSERRQTLHTKALTHLRTQITRHLSKPKKVRYRAGDKYKTHFIRQTSSQSCDFKDTQNNAERTRYLRHAYLPLLYLPIVYIFTESTPRQPTVCLSVTAVVQSVVYRSNTGIVRGFGPHSRGRYAPASYPSLHCPL